VATRAGQADVGPGDAGVFDERSTSEVVASLVTNLQGLVKTEVELAKLEVTGIVKDKAIGIGLALGGALFGVFILAFVGVTGANAFMLIVEPWLAWLIITGIYTLIAVILLLIAKRLLSKPVVPETTKDEIDLTKDWAKGQVQR
jgi:uncharacterized membrane protein YedE/YeeE